MDVSKLRYTGIKASNIFLDGKLSIKVCSYVLSRLYDHGTNPQTTRWLEALVTQQLTLTERVE